VKRSEAGFTLVETISAIALLAVLASCMSVFFFTVRRTLIKSTEAGQEAFALIKADDGLRRLAADIVVPYWEESVRGVERVQEILEAQKETPGVEVLAVGDGENGMIARYRLDNGAEAECRARFGSVPVWEGK
jgi:prepilin-type N-terminal cleavage/methylation domain-containing protein